MAIEDSSDRGPTPEQSRLLLYIEAAIELADLHGARAVSAKLRLAKNEWRAILGMPLEPVEPTGLAEDP